MARNIPGLNSQLYSPMVTSSARSGNAEAEYKDYKSIVSPLQKKLMYPTMLGAMFADPMYARPLLEKFGPKGLAAKVESTGALGAISGLSVLLPRALSEGYKSRRLAHERSYAKQLGAVGSASRALDSLSSLRNIMTLPGYTAQMLGHGSGLLRHTPRLEHFLTGQAKNVLKTGASGENTGGILSSAYGGAKNLGDFLTGGHVSGAIAAGAKKGGVAGALSSGAGLLDKGLSGLLSSPSGVMFGLMGAQIGLGIYKSIKLAKLQPNRQPPDKFARRFYSPSPSQTAINRILALAGGGKVDPQTLSFMVQQVQLSELQRLNMQMAGLRGEYHSENDFIRQEKEKGTDRMSDEYGREILGEDDRSGVSKVLDKLEHGLHTFKAKYDPIAQLVNFGVGLLQGKIITPKSETSRIADAYGYSDEKEMLKERAEQFGITADQTRLLHTTSKAILQMAPTYEGKMLAILSASFDVQRAIASEAVTIRTGMGFDKNIMYTKEKGFLSRMMSGIAGAITNIPGLNALGNLVRGTGKFITGAAAIPHKVFEKGKEALGKTRDYFFGEAYTKIKDKDEWAKAAGLYISGQDKAFDYVGNGLPNQLERIRSVLFDIYYVQDAMLQEMGGEVTKADERLIWSPTEKRYVTLKAAKELEESQKIQLDATRERAFREGPLGKMLFVADLLSTRAGKGFFDNLSRKVTVGRSLERMHGAERLTGEAEIALSGEPFTFETSRAMTEILADISSIKSTMATAVHSMAEIESERQLERTPESIAWQIRSALAVAGAVAGTLLGGPAGWVGAGAAGIAFLKARQEREKEIAEERERAIDTRNIAERGVEIQEEYFSKSFEERFGLDLLDKSNQNILQGLKKVTKHEQMIDQLKIIASYLGDENGSVYELLEPGQRIAEVTIVDRDGKSIFVDNIMPPQITQQILILKDIRDYLGGKPSSISNLLDPNQPDTAQVQVLNAAAKGGPVDKDKPMLVGEKGPEILMPRSAGMIIPNDQIDKFADGGTFKGEIFSKIYQKLSDMFIISKEALDLEIDQGKKEEKDAQQLTMMEKLQALRERLKEKAQEMWQSKVLALLSKKSDKDKKDKTKEEGSTLSKIWDFIKGNVGKILGGILAGLVGGYLLTKIDIPSLLKTAAGFAYEQIMGMSSAGRIATFAIGGAGIGLMFGPMGLLSGALIGGAIGGVINSIFDMVSGYQEGGVLGGISSFITGSMPGELASIGGNAAKWAAMGIPIGFLVGGPLGALTGALIGGVLGGAFATLQNMFIESIDAGGKGGILTGITKFLTGATPDEVTSVGGNAGKWALIGAGIGLPFGGPLGMFIGALVGGAFGALMALLPDLIGWGISAIGKLKDKLFKTTKEEVDEEINAQVANEKDPKKRQELAAKLLKERQQLIDKKNKEKNQAWATSGVQSNVPAKVLTEEDKAYQKEKDKVTTIAERDVIDKKYGRGKFAPKNTTDDHKKMLDEYNKAYQKGDIKAAEKIVSDYYAKTGKARPETGAGSKTAIAKAFAEKNTKPATPAGTPGGTPPPTVAASTSATPSGTETPKTSPTPTDTTTANVPSAPGSIASVLQEASAATGAPLGIMQKMAYAESGFDPNAKAKGSSASGLFQFIKDTWDTMLGRKGKKYGLSPDTSPFDARANALMGGESIQENIKSIQSSVLAPPPNAADVYAAHFMGADGAKQLFREIKKNPNTIAADVFPKAAKANRPIFYDEKGTPRTVRQIYEVLAQKMSTDPSAALAKAGTGLTAGEKVSEFGYKAGEKAKDIFGILGEFASKIKDAFMDALTRQFTGERIQKKPTDKKSEMKSLEAERDKYAKETSEQAQLDLAASKVSSTPHKMIENYVAERHLIILANKDFQNYYNTHLIASKKKGGKGSKLSTEDIKTAALMIAQKEFLNNPNAESIGMVANLPYKFNPDTAPFKEYLVDSKSSGTKKSEDEVAKGLRERAEKTAESEDKKDSNTTGASSKTADAAMAKSAPKIDKPIESGIGGIGKISNEELAKFQAMSDNDKFKYLEKNYPKGTPIPLNLRKEAKRLRYIDVVEPEKFGQEKNGAASENIVDAAGAKSTPVGMVDQNASPTAESQRLDNNVQQGFARLRAKREAELLGKSGENKNVTEAVTPQAAPSKGPLTDDEIMSIAADYNTSNAYRQGMILQSYSDEDQKKIIKAVSDLTENDRALSAYGYGKSQTRQMTKFESGKLTDDQKKEFLQSEYIALGKPIPRQFRDEAKRLGMLTAADSPTVVSAPTNAPTAVGAKSTPVGSKIPKKSDTNGNVAIAAGPGTNAAAAVEDELYKRSEVNNPWAKYWHGHYSASDQAVTEDIRSFQEQSPGGQRSFLKDFFDRGETPYPYLLDAAQKAGIVDKSGNLITEAAGSQYGAVKNPAQTTAGIKATADTMKTSPDETAKTAKTDEASKQEVAKKLAQLQSTIKPASQKGALVGAGGSQSVPRASGNLGTSISGPIDDLLENLFNHTLLNDLNKIYPTSYAV